MKCASTAHVPNAKLLKSGHQIRETRGESVKIGNALKGPDQLRRPTTDLFRTISTVMKHLGIARPTGGFRDTAMTLMEIFVSVVHLYTFVILISGLNFHVDDIQVPYESLTFLLVVTPSIYLSTVCMIRKKRLFALFDRINNLLAEMEDEFGPEMIKKMERQCKIVFWAHAGLFSVGIPSHFTVAYYNYYFEGVKDAAPYSTNVPFGRGGIHYNSFWQFWTYIYPISGTVTARLLMGSLAIASSRIIERTRWKFEQLSEQNNKELLRQAVKWHSEVIQIVKESNSILGSSFTTETLMSMTYICIASFMLSKFGRKDHETIWKFLTVLCMFCCLPLYFCMSGHKIATESNKLYWSIYQNYWYRLSPRDRKDLILPLMMAKAGISWNYKKIVQFDMAIYLYIVRQSYSFYALLSAVDSGE